MKTTRSSIFKQALSVVMLSASALASLGLHAGVTLPDAPMMNKANKGQAANGNGQGSTGSAGTGAVGGAGAGAGTGGGGKGAGGPGGR